MNKVKILLLRGVNVGGANRLGMPEFRIMLDELGLKSVETYIPVSYTHLDVYKRQGL